MTPTPPIRVTHTADPQRRALRRAALALTLVPLALAACGGSDSSSAPTPTVASLDTGSSNSSGESSNSGDGESSASDEPLTEEEIDRAMLEYDQCLSENGVDINTGGQGENLDGESGEDDSVAVIDDAFAEDNAEAFEKCDPIIEGVFGSFEPTPEEEAAMADAEAAFQNCMTEAGYDVSSEDGAVVADGDNAAMDEALNRCADQAFGALEGSEISGEEEG